VSYSEVVKAYLYDRLGYLVCEPEVPTVPSLPQVVIWGEGVYIAGCPDEDGRPNYYWTQPYVIADTRKNLST
jgi:hypothetical protein